MPPFDLSDDIIWGVKGPNGIAAFLGVDERKARHLIDLGVIPVRRHGHRTISASRRELRQIFSPTTACDGPEAA